MTITSSIIRMTTTEISTLSLHDALPISGRRGGRRCGAWFRPERPRISPFRPRCCTPGGWKGEILGRSGRNHAPHRSEEHTSELQSRPHLVCRLLLEKKKTITSCEFQFRL